MKEGVAMTVTYDTREGADPNLVINLGCNGIIDVLLEPISGAEISAIDQLIELASGKEPAALATIFESDNLNGKKLMLSKSKGQLWTTGIDQLDDLITFELQTALTSKKSYTKSYELNGQRISVFIEFLQPSVSLAIFGAGIDARPVTQLAKNLGWNVNVTDECVAHIAPAFFPEADNLSLCQRDFVDRQFDITSNTACVLMSHNYDYDRDVLRKLINTDTPYIGIMGPRKRFEKMLTDFRNVGLSLTPNDLERIHAPIGLDIAAQTPEEIAVSIIGEIQAKLFRRSGRFLKNRIVPIHDRDESGRQVVKIAYN